MSHIHLFQKYRLPKKYVDLIVTQAYRKSNYLNISIKARRASSRMKETPPHERGFKSEKSVLLKNTFFLQ